MNRRQFLKGLTIPLVLTGCASAGSTHHESLAGTVRVRPGDVAWPSDARWDELRRAVGGRLIAPRAPFAAACQLTPSSESCSDVIKSLKNPYYLGDQPALTQ